MAQRNQRTRVHRLWTEVEDQTLIDEIGRNPLNLRMCFIATSTQIRRTPSACASRWYTKLSKSTKKRHTAIITLGRFVAIRNRKKFQEGMETVTLENGFFQRLVNQLFRGANTQTED